MGVLYIVMNNESIIDCSGTDRLIIQLNGDADILHDKLYGIIRNSAYDSISTSSFYSMEDEFIRIHEESGKLHRLPHNEKLNTFRCLFYIRKFLLRIHRCKGLPFERP